MKSGWRTSEFWVVILFTLGMVLSAIAGWLPAEWATIAAAIADGLYAVSRGLAKQGVSDAALRARVMEALVRVGRNGAGGVHSGGSGSADTG